MAVNEDTRRPVPSGFRSPASNAHLRPRSLDVRMSYDRDSDELVSFLYGPLPHVADYVTDEVAVLVDPDTDELLGFQIDDYLTLMAPMRPDLYEVLRTASLRGIDRAEVERLIRRAQTPAGRLLAAIRSWTYRRRQPAGRGEAIVVPPLPAPLPPEMRPLLAGLGLA